MSAIYLQSLFCTYERRWSPQALRQDIPRAYCNKVREKDGRYFTLKDETDRIYKVMRISKKQSRPTERFMFEKKTDRKYSQVLLFQIIFF